MKLSALAFAACLVAGLAHPARAELSACQADAGVEERRFAQDLPPAVLKALYERYGRIAAQDEPFNASDLVKHDAAGHITSPPDTRILFVWVKKTRWVFGIERGGRGYNRLALAYEISADGKSATRTLDKYAPSVCDAARQLLNAPFQSGESPDSRDGARG